MKQDNLKSGLAGSQSRENWYPPALTGGGMRYKSREVALLQGTSGSCQRGLQCRLYLRNGGSMMLNIIIIIVIFASLLSAIVYISSSSVRQALSSSNCANAWSMAEAGYRFLSINYLKQTDTNGNGSADDEKADFLANKVNGNTYVIPNKGSFKLTVQPYWFYNSGATVTNTKSISVKIPGTTPTGFTIPSTGTIQLGNTSSGIVNFTACSLSAGVYTFTLASNMTLNAGDPVYLVLHPNASQTVTQATGHNTLTLSLGAFSSSAAFPAKDGLIQIGTETHLYRYSTATVAGSVLTLTNLRHSDKSTFSTAVTTATNIIFKKYVVLQSIGTVGPEQRILSFSEAILDSFPSTAVALTLNTAAELTANFNNSSTITKSETATLNTSGGGSATFSIMDLLSATSPRCGAFWYNNTTLINSLWAPPPVGSGVYLLSYDVQVKMAAGKYLTAGTLGLAIRAKNVGTSTETYLGLTYMKYNLANLFFTSDASDSLLLSFTNGGTTAVNSGDTVLGASSGATGIVNGTPVLTSGSWAGGNAAGIIKFSSVTGTFSDGEWLKVGGVTRAKADLNIIKPGYTLTGASSNATGIVQGTPQITSGSWAAGTAAGIIRFSSVTGTFTNNEILKVGTVNVAKNTPANSGTTYYTAAATDYIPDAIKPKPSDFSPARNNIGPLLLVLWERKSDGTFRWLAFKDISQDDYVMALQDWNEPDGSCTTSCSENDGQIINDTANIYIRIQEKRVVVGSGSTVKVNDINVFYGDNSSRYTTRTGDAIPYNIENLRLRYVMGASTFAPVWVPIYISQWSAAVDYFSHIESGTPLGSQPQFQWDAVNPNITDITLLKICDDGSADCTSTENGTLRLTELTTPDSGTYTQAELGMIACGAITTSPYSTAGFAEFAIQTPGTTSGGFTDTTLYW